MKKLRYFIMIAALVFITGVAGAQVKNWGKQDDNRHSLHLKLGMEHGTIFGVGYSYDLKTKPFPIVANVEYSFPSGTELLDDFKTRVGVHVRWLELGDVQVSTGIHGVMRRYENDLVRMVNFGSDFSGAVGYYRNNWFAAATAGFDKAIVSHLKHSDAYKQQYPDVKNGWYDPSVGGNFYYGLQGGYSFKNHDIYLKAGRMVSQDFKSKPMIPFYGELGYQVSF